MGARAELPFPQSTASTTKIDIYCDSQHLCSYSVLVVLGDLLRCRWSTKVLLDQRLHHDAIRDEAMRELLLHPSRSLAERLHVEEGAPQIREVTMLSRSCRLLEGGSSHSPGKLVP